MTCSSLPHFSTRSKPKEPSTRWIPVFVELNNGALRKFRIAHVWFSVSGSDAKRLRGKLAPGALLHTPASVNQHAPIAASGFDVFVTSAL